MASEKWDCKEKTLKGQKLILADRLAETFPWRAIWTTAKPFHLADDYIGLPFKNEPKSGLIITFYVWAFYITGN